MKKKVLISLVAVLVGVAAYTSLVDSVVGETRLDARASKYLSGSLTKALKTYAIVRGLNAVVSVAQDTDLSFSPAGVGVTTGFGELFDPINDLLERFSWVMLVATASFGIQKILMATGTWFGFKYLVPLAMALILLGIWIPRPSRVNLVSFGYKLVLLALVIRFGIPVVAAANDKVYDLFLKGMYVESTGLLDKARGEIKEETAIGRQGKEEDRDQSILDSLKRGMDGAKQMVDATGKISALKRKVANAAGHIINLIVVFMIQTVIIPLLTLWGLVKLLDYLVGNGPSAAVEEKLMELKGA